MKQSNVIFESQEMGAMGLHLASSNVVVVARQFNPSILSQMWLVDNDLVTRDEFRSGCVFSDMLAHVVTKRFLLFISPEQLQFTPLCDPELHQQLVADTVGAIVTKLPHTPYTGVGMNFIWQIDPTNDDIKSFSRRLFFVSERSLFRAFDDDEARFGGYLSKDALGCRMKLDVKPMKAQMEETEKEFMNFAFNFHLEVEQNSASVEKIKNLFERWEEARLLTESIMMGVQGDLS